jgi:hypothetical protein
MPKASSLPEGKAVVVLESFIGNINGEEKLFRQGDIISPDNPAIKKWPHFFGQARYRHEPPIEQATAAPGETR